MKIIKHIPQKAIAKSFSTIWYWKMTWQEGNEIKNSCYDLPLCLINLGFMFTK